MLGWGFSTAHISEMAVIIGFGGGGILDTQLRSCDMMVIVIGFSGGTLGYPTEEFRDFLDGFVQDLYCSTVSRSMVVQCTTLYHTIPIILCP